MLSAGFLLVKPVGRPPYVSPELVPDNVVSASDCICPQFPGPYAISWCSTSDADREDLLAAVGIPHELHGEAIQWATSFFGTLYGWPGVFYVPAAAREARERFFPSSGSVKVIGLGLPERFAKDFINEATPSKAPSGYASNGESGYLECIRRANALPSGGRPIGFEPLNLQLGMLEHSWLCNGLEQHCAVTLDVRPSPNGLLATLDDGVRCCDEISRDEVGAEPGPWYPFVIVEY